MKLNKLLAHIDPIQVIGDTDLEISAISYNSKQVENQTLFVCLKGFKSDGHTYISDALHKGASAFFVETDRKSVV